MADFDCACLEGRDCRTKLLRADEKWEHAQFDEKEIRQEGTNKFDDHDDDDKNLDRGDGSDGDCSWAGLKEQTTPVRLDYAKNIPFQQVEARFKQNAAGKTLSMLGLTSALTG